MAEMTIWYIVIFSIVAVTIAYILFNYFRIKKMPEGTEEMKEMAGIIRSGAKAFMKTEYRTIVIVVAAVSFVCYILAGFVQSAVITLPVGLILTVGSLLLIRQISKGKQGSPEKA